MHDRYVMEIIYSCINQVPESVYLHTHTQMFTRLYKHFCSANQCVRHVQLIIPKRQLTFFYVIND